MSNILNDIDIDSSVEQTNKRRALRSNTVATTQREMWNFVFEDIRDLVYTILHNDIRCGTHRSPVAENLIHSINEMIELNPHVGEMRDSLLHIKNRNKGYKAPKLRFKE